MSLSDRLRSGGLIAAGKAGVCSRDEACSGSCNKSTVDLSFICFRLC